MVQCNNPQCGEINEKAKRPMICRKCGYIMMPMEPPNYKLSKEAKASIKRGLKQKGTIDRGSFAKYAEEEIDDGDR